MTDIQRLIPQDEYNALIDATNPSSANPFATMNDVGSGVGSIGVGFYKGTQLITTSDVATLIVPYSGTITGWDIVEASDTPIASNIVIDTWKDSYTNYPPTVADTIWATKPSLTAAIKNTASGLNIPFVAGDVFKFKVDSVTNAKNVLLIIYVTKS
jgi:hypothetical protein